MLERVLREIPRLTEAVTRADLKDEPSYDVTAAGAAESVRAAGKATKRVARDKTTATRRNGAVAPRGTLAIPDYDRLTAGEVADRLSGVSQQELAKIEAYERRNKNRATVLNRTRSLRREQPSTSDAGTRANGAGAAPDEPADLRASATAGDGAAAFTLWERLRDTDSAAAERWLRTAATAGDVRAALQLGKLLWERRDVDAAEGMLRKAAVDPQGAHALGHLLWQERHDADGAETCDPA